jgi:hypothetical protein
MIRMLTLTASYNEEGEEAKPEEFLVLGSWFVNV